MRVLGIEGTAHTCGVGIVEDDPQEPDRCRVLANQVSMHRPETGGIHPRKAAEHHVEQLAGLIRAALDEADTKAADLDAIAFSQGPGLGPCLRTVATAARALALRYDIPLAGVNHCVAHLEIGRATTACTDPVMLYASGGNTQVIAEARGKYRVFGETLDIGIGNALDKFARHHEIPFPGGPEIERRAEIGAERLASMAGTESYELPELPYSVLGMDVAFSGFFPASAQLLADGLPLPEVCHAFQEWAYAMLVEVTERAMAHTGKTEVLLGGGVGRNQRLQAMLERMAQERGASFHVPEPSLLSDNGAMIAWNGLLVVRSDHATPIEASTVSQTYRTDQVELVWRNGAMPAAAAPAARPISETAPRRGAEATVSPAVFLDRPVMVKRRLPKGYRHASIERRLVARRVRHEVEILDALRRARVPAPAILDADPDEGVIVMARVPGPTMKEALDRDGADRHVGTMTALGEAVAKLHGAELVHGDLTTSNIILDDERDGAPTLIDLGLASRTPEDEARAVDLHVLQEALSSTHAGHEGLWDAFVSAYENADPDLAKPVLGRLADLMKRGRYRSMLG